MSREFANRAGSPSRKRHGVTLVELLVSITILSVLIIVVGAALVPSMRVTSRSGTAASSTTIARNVLENIEAQWSVPASSTAPTVAELGVLRNRYDRTCVNITDDFSGVPSGATVTVTAIQPAVLVGDADSVTSVNLEQAALGADCAEDADNPTVPLKRVTVTVEGPNATTASRLTLEIRRP